MTRRNESPPAAAENGRLGFSLIELLTVIAIISLLATLIVPSLGAAKTQARIARTRVLIGGIATGLEMFHSDMIIKNDSYPPSIWDTSSDGDPYGTGNGPGDLYGAQTLVVALIGADGRGTPGFKTDELHQGSGGLYEIDNNGNPKFPRASTFFEPGSDRLKKPSEVDNVDPGGSDEWLVIVDVFEMPVLYFRANPRKKKIDDIYDPNDNKGFAQDSSGNPYPLFDGAAGASTPTDVTTAFQQYIWNPTVASDPPKRPSQPHNKDSFILISAGPDRLYGTKDDITNFPLAGKNLAP